jgi:DNA-directed RNA polymerase specialized sigma24 family protein
MSGAYLTPIQSAAVACWLDGLSRRDAAAAIGCSPGAYSMALGRALRLLGQVAAREMA